MIRYLYLTIAAIGLGIIAYQLYQNTLSVADFKKNSGQLSSTRIETSTRRSFSIFPKKTRTLLLHLSGYSGDFIVDDEAYFDAIKSAIFLGDTITIYTHSAPLSYMFYSSKSEALQIEKEGIIIYDFIDHKFYSTKIMLFGALLFLVFLYLFISKAKKRVKNIIKQ